MWVERLRETAIGLAVLVLLEAVAVTLLLASPVGAHEAPPATLDVTGSADGSLILSLEILPDGVLARHRGEDHDLYADADPEALLAQITETPEIMAAAIALTVDGQTRALRFEGTEAGALIFAADPLPGAAHIGLSVSEAVGPTLLRLRSQVAGDVIQTLFLYPDEFSRIEPFPAGDAGTDRLSVITEYLGAGFAHILPMGPDHILFVIGLFLLAPGLRALGVQVTLFTFAHTLTLGLAATGQISVPAAVVEPLIAASIAFVAVENLFRTGLSRWRPLVVFGFGLLHGLGFASVLGVYGLPTDQFLLALAAFNIGVEIGQLTVLAACFLLVGVFAKRRWYRAAISVPLSVALAGVGAFWFVERLVEVAA